MTTQKQRPLTEVATPYNQPTNQQDTTETTEISERTVTTKKQRQ